MLKTVLLILALALCLNWMISLSIMAQVAKDSSIRNRFFAIAFVSSVLSGYIIYLS